MPLPDGQLDPFLSDVELSLSTYGRDQLVVIWPRGADRLARSVADSLAADSGRSPPAGVVAARLADRLGDRLGEPVTAAWRTCLGQLSSNRHEVIYRTEWNTLLLPVRGALRLRASPFDADRYWPAFFARERTSSLNLRLRMGEAVYVPRGFICELSETAASTMLLELALNTN